jgi:ELWxxDGT repeat protein
MVKDIWPGLDSRPYWLTDVGGTLYFQANDGTHGEELWKSDGTEAGTVMVRDIRPGSVRSEPAWLTDVGGTVYFTAGDGVDGRELWMSDGTEAGTVMVKDIRAGSASSMPTELVYIPDRGSFRSHS